MAVIKAQLGAEIRKMPLYNQDMTYDELVVMMQRVFKGRIGQQDSVAFKYKDDDGDLVTIAEDADLALAMQSQSTLRVAIYLNGEGDKPLSTTEAENIRRELVGIRDHANRVIETLAALPGQTRADAQPVKSVSDATTHVSDTVISTSSRPDPSEFDPLHAKTESAHRASVGDDASAPPVFGMGVGRPANGALDQSHQSLPASVDEHQPPPTIQPTQHHQVTTPPVAPPTSTPSETPRHDARPPSAHSQASVPPHAPAQAYSHPPPPTPQQQQMQAPPPPQAPPAPMSYGQQAPPPTQFGAPPPNNPPPTSAPSAHPPQQPYGGPQPYGNPQMMPPSAPPSEHGSMMNGAPPASFAPAPMANGGPPPMPPMMSATAGGGNPFARGPVPGGPGGMRGYAPTPAMQPTDPSKPPQMQLPPQYGMPQNQQQQYMPPQ